MTRREFIFLGVAGMAAMGETSARPIVSALGGRKTIDIKDKEMPSYVTDGMITWLDGEWNVGLGEHDTAPAAWVDLTGSGNTFDLVNNSEFGDNFAIISGTGFAHKADQFDLATNMKHCEAVISRTDSGIGFATVMTFRNKGGRGGGYADWYISIRPDGKVESKWYDKETYKPYVNPITFCKKGTSFSRDSPYSISAALDDNEIFVNGSEITGAIGVSTLNIGGNFIGSTWSATTGYLWSGKIFCIRCYDRILSEEERAHNLSVDSLRFGV